MTTDRALLADEIERLHQGCNAAPMKAASDVCEDLFTLLHDSVPAIIAALRAPQPDGRWRPISEAPKDGTDILAWFPEYESVRHYVVSWHRRDWLTTHGIAVFGPTHWMPLPPSPIPSDAQGEQQ